MQKIILVLVGVIVVFTGLVGYKFYQLGGQHPNWARVVRTETGGKPYYKPIQYRAKDGRPAIMKPTFVSAKEAKIADGTKGIGVAIGGEARFYPLYILSFHQIVNDSCGGKKIACTY